MTPTSDLMILLPHFTRALVTRSLFTWVALRAAAVAGMMAIIPTPVPDPILLSPAVVLMILTATALTGWVYMRRLGEDRFLLSLGFGRTEQIVTMLVPPTLLEVAIAFAVLG